MKTQSIEGATKTNPGSNTATEVTLLTNTHNIVNITSMFFISLSCFLSIYYISVLQRV